MSLNFADIAGKKLDEIEKPPLPPVGTYRWIITKLPEVTTSPDGKWDILNINCRAVEALDDVDMTDYSGQVTNIVNRLSFMFNKEDEAEFEKSLYRARTFFENHVRCAEPGDTLGQAMNNSVNQSFNGTIAWRQDKNDSDVFHANIGKTAPLD